MKNLLFVVMSFCSIAILHGQRVVFQPLGRAECEVINDFSQSLGDSSFSFMISPFVMNAIDTSHVGWSELGEKYGFDFKELGVIPRQDTLLMKRNDYFPILNPDTLLTWSRLGKIDVYDDPVLSRINSQFNRLGLCRFNRVAFSSDMKFALVQYWMDSVMLYEHGETVLMQKGAGKWVFVKTLCRFESVPNVK